jgi:hypothetical protein
MAHSSFPPNRLTEFALLALQGFQVLFLWLHDWVPLGKLNDVVAVRRQDPLATLVRITLIQSVPFTIGLLFYWSILGVPIRIGFICGFV